MNPAINLNALTFNAEQVRAVKELVREKLAAVPEFKNVHTIYSDIVVNRYIGFLGEAGLVGTKDNGCTPIGQDFSVSVTEKEWKPGAWNVRIEQCYKDLASTAAAYSLHHGVKIADFTDTDYMELVAETLTRALKKFFWRIVWFGDKEAATTAESGNLRNTVDPAYFNVIDGFWKHIFAMTENASLPISDADWSTPDKTRESLTELYYAAPIALRQQDDIMILVPQRIYDLYERSLSGVQLETMYKNMVDGQKQLTLNGVPVVAMPIWDEMAESYYTDGMADIYTTTAIITCKSNLCVGVEDEASMSDFTTNYDARTRIVFTDAMGKVDAEIFSEKLIALAVVPPSNED